MPIYGLEKGRLNAKNLIFLLALDGFNVASTPDKAGLITYLYTPCGLLLQVVHNFSVKQPIW